MEGTEMVYDQSEIFDNVKDYIYIYIYLYTCNDANLVNLDLEDIIYDYISPKLETQLAKSLDKVIVEAEVLTVLKHIKNNKSPGSDGYTAEFF